jgi:hypothetical protein
MKQALIVYLIDKKKKITRKETESKRAIKELEKHKAAIY